MSLVWKLLVLDNPPPRPDGGARVRGSGTSADFVAEKVLARPERSKELAPNWGSCIKVSLGLRAFPEILFLEDVVLFFTTLNATFLV